MRPKGHTGIAIWILQALAGKEERRWTNTLRTTYGKVLHLSTMHRFIGFKVTTLGSSEIEEHDVAHAVHAHAVASLMADTSAAASACVLAARRRWLPASDGLLPLALP